MKAHYASVLAVSVFCCSSPGFGEELRECSILVPDGAEPRGTYNLNLWTNGVVPYEFDANVSASRQNAMLAAMDEWEVAADVTFRPRNGDSNYVHIQDSSGNNSFVGMIGGGQTINIFNWSFRFIMAHELGHALGLWHEQSRPDRDAYIQINLENVCQTCCSGGPCDHNFGVRGAAYGAYDFESVMHYGPTAFSVNGQPTITVLPPYQAFQGVIGQRTHLSDQDKATMAFLYGAAINCENPAGRGDSNCDSHIDAGDIPSFVQALLDPAGYLASNPGCLLCQADLNDDGMVDGTDIQLFIEAML